MRRQRFGAGFDRAERRGVGVQTGIDRHLVVVVRVIAGGIGREAARRAMLEALVHRKDDQLASTTETALHQDAGQLPLVPGLSLS